MSNTLIAQLNNPAVLQQINQRSAAIVSLLLLVACAYVLAEMTWLFFPQDDEAAVAPVRRTAPVANNQQQNKFRQLTSANIFGINEKKVVKRQTKAPVTRLNLSLKGVLAATPMELASAIIAQGKGGKEDTFSVGDKMPNGVVIKEIHPDHVVLERSGRDEILKLQKESGLGTVSKTSTLSTSAKSPGQALKQIRKNILKNPTSFGEYALPVVVKENGKQIGYRLQPQQKGQLLSELGLQKNDVITQINGIKLNEPKNGISALRKLSTAKTLNLVVKRNGAETPLTISLN